MLFAQPQNDIGDLVFFYRIGDSNFYRAGAFIDQIGIVPYQFRQFIVSGGCTYACFLQKLFCEFFFALLRNMTELELGHKGNSPVFLIW